MKKKPTILAFFTLLLLFGSGIPLQAQQIKKRIAVFVFEDKSDQGSSYWYRQQSVGEGMADMITTELVKSGNYRVIERQELDEILKEQDLGQSGIVTPQSAAAMGQVLGVELAVVGTVSEFGMKENETGGAVKGVGIGLRNTAAVVGLDVRLINTSTAEIVSAENVRRQKTNTGVKFNTRKVSFQNRNEFDQSIIGKATREAIEDVVKMIDNNAATIPWQAKVIMEQGGKVFINAGANDGLSSGDVFAIYRKGTDLVDPDTGLSLGSTDTKIGEIRVSNPGIGNGKASECSIVSGDGFEKGDFVRIQ